VAFCDERIVVDAHSTDTTRELARALDARVIEHDWPGFRSQKDFAVKTASPRLGAVHRRRRACE